MCTFLNKKDEDSNKRRQKAYIIQSLGKIRIKLIKAGIFRDLSSFLWVKNRFFITKISLNSLISQLFLFIVLLAGIYPYHIEAEVENVLNSGNSVNILIQNQNNTFFYLIPQKFNSSSPFAFNFGDYNSLNSLKLDSGKDLAQNENHTKKYLWVTAYSSSPDETDEDPFITATGSEVRDGIVATNILPFGTKIKIPFLFGDKIFVVEDRMHYRKTNVVDVWMDSKEKAIKFGAHYTKIVILSDESEFARK
jgi:3D (Asp-Asp-Asp) domain-containing protein